MYIKLAYGISIIIGSFLYGAPDHNNRKLHPHEITITVYLGGHLTTRFLKKPTLEKYTHTPTQSYYPSKEGGFVSIPSITDPTWSFPVYFKGSDTPSLKERHLKKRILVITLSGLGGYASDMGPFASALRPYADIMLLGTVVEAYPYQQNPQNQGENFKEGSLALFLNNPKTKTWGGGLKRMIEAPIEDIIKLLDQGVTVTNPDGSVQYVRPYNYGTIIAVGLCIGNSTLIKVQEKLIERGKREFDGFIMESPLADFDSSIPNKWAHQAGFGGPYPLMPSLLKLKLLRKAKPAYILRGGQDNLCTTQSVTKVLYASDSAKSKIVTILPVGHARSMYNDTFDRGSLPPIKNKWVSFITRITRPRWEHIDGCRQAQTGLMQEWLIDNFINKP